MLLQHSRQLLQLRSQHTKFLLKNYTILIDNTRKDTIFVDVKTAYLSHRHNKFWDTKPVKHMRIIAARREATTARLQR